MKVKFFLVCALLILLVSCTDESEELIEQMPNKVSVESNKVEIKSCVEDENYVRGKDHDGEI